MRIRLLLVLFAALPAPLAAQPPAPDWRVIARDEAGESGPRIGGSIAFVDLHSLVRRGDQVEFTMEVRFRNRQDANGPNGMLSAMRAECSTFRWGSFSTIMFRGTAEHSRSGPTEMSFADVDTKGRQVINAVCNGVFEPDPVADPIAYARGVLGED
jgi:hypothetical protein